ncbi:MAG TPA: OmpH family outer membrane protein [Chitinophagaceae bacterium]
MKKIRLFLVIAVIAFSFTTASAQKTGYISLDQVVSLMPEVRKIDSLLQKYQADSLNPQFTYMLTEYNRKDSIANGKDSLKTPATVRAQIRQELEGLAYQLQNWQSIVQNALQQKQNDFLEPIYVKAMNALNAVAKENGYSYVFNKESLLVAPPGDELLPLVAKKLNLKLPPSTAANNAAAPKK